ncbi:unnamed protein product [Schistosoma margrebowiei]|uniref:Uncharacterized protein n=1 Tax=Schistosoma margrebowiei TaxID=48269 RepID=A0AA85A2J0_9TREM|nr:unnamed protein product [Schistosoma margrebowiei]
MNKLVLLCLLSFGPLMNYSAEPSRLSVFWIVLVLSTKPPHKNESLMNKTVWESKISEALKSTKISYSEYFNLVEAETRSVVVDYLERDESRSYLKIFFYVQQNNLFQPSPSIVYQLNQMPVDWLAVYLGMPVIERPKVYDIGAYEKEDDFIWIIGIIAICFLGILLICWCFIFLYTFVLQATAMVKWLPRPMISNSKQIFYKTEKSQREFEEKKDSQIQTDDLEFSQSKISKTQESNQNKSICDRTVRDSNFSAQLSTVSEISLEESVNPTISELNESVLPLSETQVLLSDEEDGIINQKLNEIKVNTKNLKNEVIEENEGDLLQASEIDKTLTFGSFDNVIPFVMSVPPRPEAIKLANLLNSQKITKT